MARSEAVSSAVRRVLPASRARTAQARLQAEAWSAWLVAASVAVFLTSNPFYLATAALVGLVVYASLPSGRRRRAYGLIVKIGLFFALLSIPFNVLTGSSGSTALLELPRLTFPNWLGGVTFGGQTTVESLVYAVSRALRLVALLLFATAFNVGVDHYRLLRLVPRALRQLGVVVTVSVLLLPQAFAQGRAVADAQRLRGRRMRGIRDAGAFVVPVLAGALERSIQRAESLDARGFGSMPSAQITGRRTALLTSASIGLTACGAFLYVWRRQELALIALLLAGLAAALAVKSRGGGVETSRYSRESLTRPSALVAGCALLSLALLSAMRIVGAGDIDYFPSPTAALPEFNALAVLAVLLLLAPAFHLAASDAREDDDD